MTTSTWSVITHPPLVISLGWTVFAIGVALKTWQLGQGLYRCTIAISNAVQTTESMRHRLEQAWQRDQGRAQSRAANTEA